MPRWPSPAPGAFTAERTPGCPVVYGHSESGRTVPWSWPCIRLLLACWCRVTNTLAISVAVTHVYVLRTWVCGWAEVLLILVGRGPRLRPGSGLLRGFYSGVGVGGSQRMGSGRAPLPWGRRSARGRTKHTSSFEPSDPSPVLTAHWPRRRPIHSRRRREVCSTPRGGAGLFAEPTSLRPAGLRARSQRDPSSALLLLCDPEFSQKT